MDRLNRKGFTLVELLATIILLSIIMGIGSYSIINILNNTKEKNYKNLIEEINNAVEGYYQECRFVNNACDSTITLGFLVANGYLKGNEGDDLSKLVNPKDNEEITGCSIKYAYSDGKINVEAVNPSEFCPTTCDYNPDDDSCSVG